jgi:predicted DNA-binding protein (MmcQ/YjbR family)
MTNESVREFCLGMPHATEVVQWESHLLFKIGGKMFAIIDLEGHSCAFRCTPESYAELTEMPDIVPASHNMWKYQWVTTETLSALPDREFRARLTQSYEIVRATLPKRTQRELSGESAPVSRRESVSSSGSPSPASPATPGRSTRGRSGRKRTSPFGRR